MHQELLTFHAVKERKTIQLITSQIIEGWNHILWNLFEILQCIKMEICHFSH